MTGSGADRSSSVDRRLRGIRRWILGKAPAAVVHRLQSLTLLRIARGRVHTSRSAARVLLSFAGEYDRDGRKVEALDLRSRVREALAGRYGPDDHDVLGVEASMAQSLFDLELWTEALAAFERLEHTYGRIYGTDTVHQIGARLWVALTLGKMGRFEDSLSIYLPAVDALEAQVGEDSPQLAGNLMNLGSVQLQAGNRSGALRSMRRGLDIRGRVLGPDDPRTLSSLRQLAWALAEHGELDEAGIMAANLLDKVLARHGPDHEETVKARRLVERIRQAGAGGYG